MRKNIEIFFGKPGSDKTLIWNDFLGNVWDSSLTLPVKYWKILIQRIRLTCVNFNTFKQHILITLNSIPIFCAYLFFRLLIIEPLEFFLIWAIKGKGSTFFYNFSHEILLEKNFVIKMSSYFLLWPAIYDSTRNKTSYTMVRPT